MIEMKTEVYINKIIEDTGLTRKEIQNLVEDKKNELKGLISDEGALFIIAKELGVDIKSENKDLLKDIEIFIADITHLISFCCFFSLGLAMISESFFLSFPSAWFKR